jgi:hypothetical protein
MPTFLLAYHGGRMAETDDEQEQVMNDWIAWFGAVGEAMKDPGMPVIRARTIGDDGEISDGGGDNPVSGYSVLEADSLDAAVEAAKGCPVLKSGGSIEVAEVGMAD